MINLIYKSIRKLYLIICSKIDMLFCIIHFKGNKVEYNSFNTTGFPFTMVARGGFFKIGKNFKMNNGIKGNPIGCYSKCTFFIDKDAQLIIGDNVGISQTAIICYQKISIENNVKIGGGVKIYDTDFHSLDSVIRASSEDFKHRRKASVCIKNGAFIGAFSMILKGVSIGENSIVGAGSVVTKSIPDNQIWAGNPAKFIRDI